ncbi:E3 ubiquitin-protein ligase TRIM7-like [Gastrophryne carolinensis]
MASSDLRKALDCSVCLNIFTDPVNLKCGHSFCRVCINQVLGTQEASGVYLCPICRDEFGERPELHKNLTLHNLVEDFLSSQPDEKKTLVPCTYCVDSAVAAFKSCLLCEASLCENHLKVHSKAPEHVLSRLASSPVKRNCGVHRKVLEYYCTEHGACICASCKQDVEHRGHTMETLDKAAEKKKNTLRNDLIQLMNKSEDTRKRVQSLQKQQRETQKKAAALSGDIRRYLEVLEKRVQGEVERKSLAMSDLIQALEVRMDELFQKIHHTEELCNTADPLIVLQDSETGDLCDAEEGCDEGREMNDEGDLQVDVAMIVHALRMLSDITVGVKRGVYGFYLSEAAQIFLDENTANNALEISDNMKVASRSPSAQNRPQTSQRFYYYPQIGRNNKSWGLEREQNNRYSVIHDSKQIPIPDLILMHRVRVYVNIEAGQVSFYHLSHPMRHLHTFTTTFTEPLHAALQRYTTTTTARLYVSELHYTKLRSPATQLQLHNYNVTVCVSSTQQQHNYNVTVCVSSTQQHNYNVTVCVSSTQLQRDSLHNYNVTVCVSSTQQHNCCATVFVSAARHQAALPCYTTTTQLQHDCMSALHYAKLRSPPTQQHNYSMTVCVSATQHQAALPCYTTQLQHDCLCQRYTTLSRAPLLHNNTSAARLPVSVLHNNTLHSSACV